MNVDPSLAGLAETASAFAQKSIKVGILSRMGFSEVTLPKVNVTEISYRENIDNPRFMKMPGLVKYDNITLRRGVTSNRDLYDWFRLVNDELILLATAQELSKDRKFPTTQSDGFRKDIVIEVLDREGNSIKGWYLFNAWPVSYKPGNDLNASAEEKLIEELSLTYELFLELEGGLKGFAKEIAKNVAESAVNSVFDQQLPYTK